VRIHVRLPVFVAVLGLSITWTATGAASSVARAAQTPDPNATLRVSASITPSQWDPHSGSSDAVDYSFMGPVYDRLLELKGDLTFGPMLATSYKLSPDKLSLTLKLRTDVTFPDGTPFDAAAVVANINYAKGKNNSLIASSLATITNVIAVDPSTVRFDFSVDATNFPLLLAKTIGISGMVSPKALLDPATLKTTPAGSGPYKLASQTQDRAIYEKVSSYWDPKLLKRLPQHVEIIGIADDNARVSALQSGQLDAVALQGPLANIATVVDGKNIKSYTALQSNRLLQVQYNFKNPALAMPDVRKALSMATDDLSLAKTICQGTCIASSQPFTKGGFGYNSKVKVIKYNPVAAKALLAKAGFPNGFNFNMEMANIPLFVNLATAIQAEWAQIGVKVTVVPVLSSTVGTEWRSGKYDGFLLATNANPDGSPIISTFFAPNTPLSGAFQPFGGDPQVTTLESKASLLPLGSKQRNAAYQEIAAYLGANPASTIIAIWPPQYLYKTSVTGVSNTSFSKLTTVWDVRPLSVTKKA